MPTTHPTPVFHGPVHAHWREMAAAKGFDLIARINDRYHLHLRCRTCGGGFTAKLFTLMRHQPLCPHCLAARRSAVAATAGVTFLGPDPDRRGYGRFRAPCSHVLARQFELIERVAKGATGLRCETCHAHREASEARRFGWERLGYCPAGRPNYRR